MLSILAAGAAFAVTLPALALDRPAPQGPPPEVLLALEKGARAERAGRHAEARVEYEKVLALTARPEAAVTLHEMIARCHSEEGNYARALVHLQHVLDADPADLTVRLVMAQEALRGGLVERGMEILKGVDQGAIKEPEILYNIAAMFLNQGRTEEAVAYLTAAVRASPTFVDGYYQRGLAYLQLQQMDLCKADLRKVQELAPGTPQAETARKALEQLP